MKVVKGTVKGQVKKGLKLRDDTIVFDATKDPEDIYYDALNEHFQTGDVSSDSWLAHFAHDTLSSIKKGMEIDPTIAVKGLREVTRLVQKTKDHLQEKQALNVDFSRYLLQRDLFEWQKEVYEDTSKKIALLCGRRSGKSFVVSRLALKHVLSTSKKKREAIIIGLTLEKTANLYWSLIKDTIEHTHIPTLSIDNGKYEVTFTNGNVLRLGGNSTKAEREKVRGADYSFVAIDEMQSQPGLYYLINDILKPILKGTDGTLVTLGTAPLSAGTLWEYIQSDESFSHYHATMEQNPSIPNYEHALQDVLLENKWTPDNITFRREFLGEIAYDTQRMIYPKRTYYDKLPDSFREAYIGVDFGWSDYSSFAPILIDKDGDGWLIKEWKQNKTPSSELVKTCKDIVSYIQKTYSIPMEDIHVVADSSHQQVSADFYNAGVLSIQNAHKLEENYQIARVAEGLETGTLHVKKGDFFDQECDRLLWRWNSEKGCVIYQIDEDVYHPDMADSVKYAWNTYLSGRLA